MNEKKTYWNEQYDVVIVGAGTAGVTCALKLVEQNCSVLVLEKRNQLGIPIQCAEFVPFVFLQEYDFDDSEKVHRVDRMLAILPNGKIRETVNPGYMINKDRFIINVAKKAIKKGAHILTGARAISAVPGGLIFKYKNSTFSIEAAIIIGADGPLSTVGKWIQSVNRKSLTALQYTYAVDCTNNHDIEIYFDRRYTCGYAWFLPKRDAAYAGVVVDDTMGGRPGHALEYLIDILVKTNRINPCSELGRTGGLIPVRGFVPFLQKDNILLVGDAAGLTHPITGGGNHEAFVSGKVAADIAANAAKNNDMTLLKDYSTNIHRLFDPTTNLFVKKRKQLEEEWNQVELNELIEKTWIGF